MTRVIMTGLAGLQAMQGLASTAHAQAYEMCRCEPVLHADETVTAADLAAGPAAAAGGR